MKILELPLKSEWYLMIESGVKLEEYREIKPYWSKRLVGHESPLFSHRYGYQQANGEVPEGYDGKWTVTDDPPLRGSLLFIKN